MSLYAIRRNLIESKFAGALSPRGEFVLKCIERRLDKLEKLESMRALRRLRKQARLLRKWSRKMDALAKSTKVGG